MQKKIMWIAIPLLLVGSVIVNWNYISKSIEWKLNWGFTAPITSKIETVFHTKNGFPNEGETFHVLNYRSVEKKLKEKDGWCLLMLLSTVSHLGINTTFQKDVISINKDAQNLNLLFQENPVTYDNHDKYFYKLEEDNSYILVISNVKEQKLFVMEWIQ